MSTSLVRRGVAAAASFQAVLGGALLFAGREASALVLLRHAVRQPSPAVVALAAAYGAGALFFVWLLRSPGVARKA